ncbi:hypothetical protein NKDENANG_02091 [Candidatus Entotheonellaceae bacterium PAL068K]
MYALSTVGDHRHQVTEFKVRRFREAPYWGKPVSSFGDPQVRVLIIGMAPAAHGGNRTGRAFTGDHSGAWLYKALYTHGFANRPTSEQRQDGLRLHDCYITQVLHCALPRNKPTRQEIDAGQTYMLAEFRLLTNLRVTLWSRSAVPTPGWPDPSPLLPSQPTKYPDRAADAPDVSSGVYHRPSLTTDALR